MPRRQGGGAAAPVEDERQLSLLDNEQRSRYETSLAMVSVSSLIFDEDRLPSSDLVENVLSMGILEPLSVKVNGGGYIVINGHKRARIALNAGWSEVPAIVWPHDTPYHVMRSMSLSANLQARGDVVRDLDDIMVLERRGMSPEQIANELHIPRSVIEGRMRLLNILPGLMSYIRSGIVSRDLADSISRLSGQEQVDLFNAINNEQPESISTQWVRTRIRAIRRGAREAQEREREAQVPLFVGADIERARVNRFMGNPNNPEWTVVRAPMSLSTSPGGEVSGWVGTWRDGVLVEITHGGHRYIRSDQIARFGPDGTVTYGIDFGEVTTFAPGSVVPLPQATVATEARPTPNTGRSLSEVIQRAMDGVGDNVAAVDAARRLVEDETWDGCVALLTAAALAMPAEPNDTQAMYYQKIGELVNLAMERANAVARVG